MNDITAVVKKALLEAGDILREGFAVPRATWRNKGAVDLVTEWDMKSEATIRKIIADALPGHAILGEEGGGTLNREGWLWIVDPLDGTTNFVHRLPYFSISIACQKDGVTVAGGVHAPMTGELFLAEKGGGAFLNGEKIAVSSVAALSEALFVTGFPYDRSGWFERLERLLANALANVQCVRRMGSAALDLCHVASGIFDSYIEFELKPWDIAAGVLVLEEAGGRVSRGDGSPLDLDGRQLVATNGLLHELTLSRLLPGVL